MYCQNVGGEAMEFVMSKIMNIDKDAESYRGGIDELLKEKQDELENIIKDMKAHFQEESKNIKNAISNEKIVEAEYRVRNIKKEKEEQLNNINTKYQSNKLEIVDEVFRRIINLL